MKKQTISGFTLKLILLLAVIALYVNFIYFPLDKKMAAVILETQTYQEAADKYAEYWHNPSLLVSKIEELRKEIYNKGKTTSNANPVTIADDISSLLLKTGAKLASLTIGDPQSQEVKSANGQSTLYAVPIELKLSSSAQSNIAFVSAIENFKSGAYSIGNISYTESDGSFSISMQMKFFTVAG